MPTTPDNSGIPESRLNVLVGLYRDAAARVRKVVLHPEGASPDAIEFRRARAAMLALQIDRLVSDLGAKTRQWTSSGIREAYQAGLALGEKQLRGAGVSLKPGESGVKGSFNLIDRGAVEVFAHDIAGDMAKAAKSMGDRAKSLLKRTAATKINTETGEVIKSLTEADIDRILAGGVISGAPVQTIRALREELRSVAGGRIAVVGKSGKLIEFEVGYYAKLVARTKTRQAMVTAQHQRIQSVGIDLVMVIGRESENFCTEYLGDIFSLSGKSKTYPALSSLPGGGPPFHPQCSKSTRPFVEELADAA